MKVLALDIGGTAIKSGFVEENGAITEFRSTPTGGLLPEIFARTASEVVKSYGDYDVLAVSIFGLVDCKRQVILTRESEKGAENAEVPIGKMFRDAAGRPVVMLNDANAAAFGEACFGAGKGKRDFLCLTFGTGVGGGIVQNGALLEGSRGIAGELGHIKIRAGGPRCRCGRRGCYQEYASATALLREAKKLCPDLTNARELFERLPAEPRLRRVIDRWIGEIAEGLCSYALIFDPARIVLGGGVMERPEVTDAVRREFRRRAVPAYRAIEIAPAALGNRAGMIGAAEYARQTWREKK